MHQRSDPRFRAEKLYKHSKGKFGFLLRETVSNAIHAALIRADSENAETFKPTVHIRINHDPESKNAVIEVIDNGEGFNEHNRTFFDALDKPNNQKMRKNFHPQGQGRLAIVFFADTAEFRSTFKDSNGSRKFIAFPYPTDNDDMFSIPSETALVNNEDPGTILKMCFTKNNFSRFETYLKKIDGSENIGTWFTETFFGFIIDNKELALRIQYNDSEEILLTKGALEKKIVTINFEVDVEGQDCLETFTIWLAVKGPKPKRGLDINCYARQLNADIEDAKLSYDIDLPEQYTAYLTSPYFDNNVDQKGDKIRIETSSIEEIQTHLNAALDKHFTDTIRKNRIETAKSIDKARTKYHSIAPFIERAPLENSRLTLSTTEILDEAIKTKGKAEKDYWVKENVNSDLVEKLVNSSLHVYINHRQRILTHLNEMISRLNNEGEEKKELEDTVHDIFLKRGTSLNDNKNNNHLHNLWILDDKYTIFTESRGAISTKRGEAKSDVYYWIDDPGKTKEILILELKSTTHAHNAGSKYESMVAQVSRYASKLYENPEKVIGRSLKPDQILYSAIILARKSDVYTEIRSSNVSGNYAKIPFLECSYYWNEKFALPAGLSVEPERKDIRVELYSYEDIFELARSRNNVFFKLLAGELHTFDSQ